jgi:outer membrane protein, multidrug efflux system
MKHLSTVSPVARAPWSRWTPLLAALVLAGCASAPAVDPGAIAAAPASFKHPSGPWVATVPTPALTQTAGDWWRIFDDPTLDALIEHADRYNTQIAQSAARLKQSQALLRHAQSDRSVHMGFGAGATRRAGGDTLSGSTPSQLFNANLQLSYEVDLWGRLDRATDAASLDAQSRAALLQSTRLLVQSQVAQTYLTLRTLDLERSLVRDTVAAYRDTLSLTQSRFQAGDVAELDLARVSSEVASTESDALALDRQRALLEHALATLVGEAAADFSLPGSSARTWVGALPVIPEGVPATVLTRRPDVLAARANLLGAQTRVGVAQSAWFPNLSLTAAGGAASSDLSDVFRWSARAWGVGALLSLPLLDGGRRAAGIEAAQAQLDEATATYRSQVLTAFQDVEDQLASLQLLAQQSQAQDRAVGSAQQATRMSDARYRNGLTSQLELLDARRSELRNRRQALAVRSAQFQATVMLIRALGGSWGPARSTAQDPAAAAKMG